MFVESTEQCRYVSKIPFLPNAVFACVATCVGIFFLFTDGVVKAHICDTCGKAFRAPSDLARHELVHKNAKSVACPICGKYFRHQQRVNVHMAMEHKDVSGLGQRESVLEFPWAGQLYPSQP